MAARPQRRGRARARRPFVRLLAAALLGLAACAVSPPCAADDQQAFEFAKTRFDAGRYDEAHDRFAILLNPALPGCDKAAPSALNNCRLTDPELVERARAFDAAALLALKRGDAAEAQIEAILRANPRYAPNAALFPQEVLDRFTTVRARLQPELVKILEQEAKRERDARIAQQKAREAEQKWIEDLQKAASEQRVIEKRSRLLAFVPFGVGQFQNGDTALGIVFATGESLFGLGTLISYGLLVNYASQNPNQAGFPFDTVNQFIQTTATVNRILFTAWVSSTVIGIVQAQIAFVPEKVTIRKQILPPRPKAMVSVLPGGGVGFAIEGVF